MTDTPPLVAPPFVCLICGADGPFGSEEHIVPHSLGNDLLVLGRGWVCDRCNNTFSEFESRVLFSSILGAERCRMGVTTKRHRPAHSRTHGISWFAKPSAAPNTVDAEADWSQIPVMLNADGSTGKMVFPLHDDTNFDIAKLLLKIGVEIIGPVLIAPESAMNYDLSAAKKHLLAETSEAWPYFVLRDASIEDRLVSVLSCVPEEHEYIRSLGFDIFLHDVNEQAILFFTYGEFRAGISLTSRDTRWREVLLDWKVSHVGCPAVYADQCAQPDAQPEREWRSGFRVKTT